MVRTARVVAAMALVGAVLAGGLAVASGTGEDPPATSTPAARTSPPAPTHPGPEDTGVAGCGPLEPATGQTVSEPGAVLENLDIRGQVVIAADDVTLRCVRVRDDVASDYVVRNTDHKGLRLERVAVSCMGAPQPAYGVGTAYYTATAVDVSDCQDGFMAAWDTTIERSYCHDLLAPPVVPEAHTQCVQVIGYGGDGTTVDRIRIVGNTLLPARRHATAAVIVQSAFGRVDDVRVEDNLMDHGTYTVYSRAVDCCVAPTNVRFVGNRFRRGFEFGLRSFEGDVAWADNVWDDTGQPIPAIAGGEG